MPAFKVGDTVVHLTQGSGKVTAVDDKGPPGHPCFYYVVEANEQTLWIPVEETGNPSLHLPTSRADFDLLIKVLRSPGEKFSNNPYQRRDELDERMHMASPTDLCLVIRDLTHRTRSQKLSNSDIRVLKQAQSYLLDEWERSLGTPREKAKLEMESILKYQSASSARSLTRQ